MKIKKYIIPAFCVIILTLTIIYNKSIVNKVTNILNQNPKLTIPDKNQYAKNTNYLYIQKDTTYHPYNYQELLNVYYSILDNGWEEFTFYCPNEYTNCIKDIESLSRNQNILSYINNFIAPYNSFKNIYTSYDETGEITIKVTKLYSKEKINYIEKEINKIFDEVIDDNMSDYEKIKKVHDYIINNTRYDESATDYKVITDSSTAYGLFKYHLATCNGYSDAMAIVLNRLNIKNYKIAITPTANTSGHVWNAVYLDGEWLHLDLTWDDPISSDKKDYLYHKYFLVDNKGLADADKGEVNIDSHNYKDSIYLEFKKQ